MNYTSAPTPPEDPFQCVFNLAEAALRVRQARDNLSEAEANLARQAAQAYSNPESQIYADAVFNALAYARDSVTTGCVPISHKASLPR